jgi:hypothetical protein
MKSKLLIGLHIALVWAAMLLAAQPAAAQFRLPIIVRDNGNDSLNLVTKRDTLYFGVHPQATYCIDPGPMRFTPCDSVSEAELPPPPPAGVFDARWVDLTEVENACINGLRFDIRTLTSPSDVDTFQLKFQPGAGKYPFVFKWPKNLGTFVDSMRLRDANTGLLVNVNMLAVDSVKVTSSSVKQLRIYVYHPKNQTVPPVPTLTAPANTITQVDTPVTFTWSASAGAQSYLFQLSTAANFSTLVRRDTITSTTTTIRGLQWNRTYYWRVSANTAGMTGCFAPTFSFTTFSTCEFPTLVSPANNATGVALTGPLSWTPPSGATVISYQVQLARDTNFTSIVKDTTVTGTSVNVGTLLNCASYFWRVKTNCSIGSSQFTPGGRKFSTVTALPAVPTLTSPAANATGVLPTNIVFTWSIPDSCSKNYRLQVSADTTDADPAHLAVNDSVNTATRTVPSLQQGTDYFWHVRAGGASGNSAYSPWRKFRTAILPPGAPTNLSPANGDTTVPINAILRWTTVVRADSYQVQVATSNLFTTIVYTSPFTTDTTATTGALVNCSQYFWRVSAKNVGGSGSPSATTNFKVVAALPGAPTLTFPANGQDSVDGQPTLTWTSTDPCVRSYRIQVATDAGFSAIVNDVVQSGTSLAIGPLESNTTYFWKVTPSGTAGGGTASAVFSFITTPFTAPSAPALLSPPNRQTNVAFPVSVCWDSSARATVYRLQVAIDSTFGVKVFDDSTLTARCRQLVGLLNGKTYFWRVSAKNGAGVSPFSPAFRFTTLSPPLPPILISPANGEEGVNAVAQFLWSIPETASSYRFQLSLDSAFTQIVKDDSTILVTSTQAGPLESHRKYYWRVRGKNTSGVGAYSPISSFRTDYVGVSNWRMALNARENGNAQETIYFGLHPDATAGIDPALDEFELPPPDFFGTFDVRFVGPPLRPTSIGEGLRLNLLEFRTYTQIDTYKVRFQPGFGGYPITFTWSPVYVRIVCDSMVMIDEFGGNTVRRRMDTDSTAVVTNTSLSNVLIIKYGAHPILDVPTPGHDGQLPRGFTLSQNFPNPFNPTTTIRFSTETVAEIDVIVYDVLGRIVSRLANRTYFPGEYGVTWDGKNDQGMVMPSGMYYVRMTALSQAAGDAERFSATRKMLLMK